jgi:hypothetical protein
MSNMVPSEDGYYWMKTEFFRQGATVPYHTQTEVVRVFMKWAYRGTYVPYVIGCGWRSRVDKLDSGITFSPKITPPQGFEL